MPQSWRYRLLSFVGAAMLVITALSVANLQPVQEAAMVVPVVDRLDPITVLKRPFLNRLPVAALVVLVSLWPLYKPQPRHVLDIISLTEKRVLVATFALATIGYFDYTYQLPRGVLIVACVAMLVVLPAWFVLIRKQGNTRNCALIVGDDPETIAAVYEEIETPVFGYVAFRPNQERERPRPVRADGNGAPLSRQSVLSDLDCLGGLSRLEDILIAYRVDTVILAFSHSDREEFFGTLNTCAKLGVNTKVHRALHDSVLTMNEPGYSNLVDIDLDPWDWQDRVAKRLFDLAFSTSALLVLAPVMVVIAIAIKLDDGGSLFYAQERTSSLGDTFSIIKFRTMAPGSESSTPGEETHHVTRVGTVLRKTHLDEIPQLLAILNGQMSVVGPRAAWTDEEAQLQTETPEWRKRWFVKPGLTGLAQVNDVTSTEAKTKLQYDIEYIRKQSIRFDVEIVTRQLTMVLEDVIEMVGQKVRRQ